MVSKAVGGEEHPELGYCSHRTENSSPMEFRCMFSDPIHAQFALRSYVCIDRTSEIGLKAYISPLALSRQAFKAYVTSRKIFWV